MPICFRIHIADEIQPFGTIAILNGKAHAIKRQTNTTPRPVKGFLNLQGSGTIGATRQFCPIHRLLLGCRNFGFSTLLVTAQTNHQTAQHFRLKFRIWLTRLPHGIVRPIGISLIHPTMADENIDSTGLYPFLETRTELVPLRCRVKRIKNTAQKLTQPLIANLGSVFRPICFHHPDIGHINLDHEARFLPEILHLVPKLVRPPRDNQPALITRALDPRLIDLRQDIALLPPGLR